MFDYDWQGAAKGRKDGIWSREMGRTYGSWSIAQGINAGISVRSPKIWGNELEKDGVAWTAAKWYMPTLSLLIVSTLIRTLHSL